MTCITHGHGFKPVAHKRESTPVKDPSWFETQSRRHQKFKTGVSVAPQKGLMSSKTLNKFDYQPYFLGVDDLLHDPSDYS